MRRAALAVLFVATLAHAERETGWELRVAERTEVAPGAAAPLAISIAVDRGLTVSKDAPVIVDLDPDPGAAVKKKRLGRGDAVDPEADAPRFSVAVRGEAPGDHPLRVRVRFWLCGARRCRPVEAQRVTTIAVGEPSAPN